jgi:serine phosphatase RsbU (regulator of sigma subunit)
VALAGVLTGLAFAGESAGAQLLPLPSPNGLPQDPVGQVLKPVQEVVHQPLPSPLEEVVQDSPVAPLRDQVREVVGSPGGGGPPVPTPEVPPQTGGGGSTGGGSKGGGSAGGGNPSAGAAGAGPVPATSPTSTAAPRTDGGSRPSSGSGSERNERNAPRRDADRRPDRGGERTGRAGTVGADDAPAAGEDLQPAAARPRRESGGDEAEGPIARTVERIVEVVPGAVWAALGALALLALALAARSGIDRRRTLALQRERERLLRDMGLLERVLLPQVPERLGDLAASVAYQPAAGPAAGGDFYDVFELPGGRVALVVGDVSGHGREALERTSSLRPTLRGHLEAGLSPRAAIASAGRVAGVDENGGFTTAIAAVHDPGSGTLTYAAAGHPPPILVGPGAHEPLTAASAPPLGVGLRTGLRQTTVPLPREAAACFFTDGLLEARVGHALVGREWLAGVIAEFGPFDAAAALLERVIEHADDAPDDMTACLVRAVAGPQAGGPRVEELDVVPDDLDTAAPGRFLEACGLPPEAAAAALAEVRDVAERAGGALLTVTIDGERATAQVTAPAREALATT